MNTNLSKNILNWLWAIAALLAMRFFAGIWGRGVYQFCTISLILGTNIYLMLKKKQID